MAGATESDMQHERDNLVVGRGTLYFDQFAPGTTTVLGEQYLGNTPSLTIKSERTTRTPVDSVGGRLVELPAVTISEKASGEFTGDNISARMVALWFAAEASGIAAPADAISSVVTAYRGRYYQIGVTAANPMGRRNLSSMAVVRQSDSTPIAAPGNYVLNERDGRIQILPDSGIADGTALAITAVADTVETIYRPTGKIMEGALRFVADPAYGMGTDYFFPSVELAAAADQALKGDMFQELRFTFTAKKRPGRDLYYFATKT